MSKGFLLTESDQKLLRDLIARERSRAIARNRPAVIEELGQTPDVYIACAPVDGIPALSVPGTGTALTDEPGQAECDIFRIIGGTIEAVTGFSKIVNNLSASEIAEGEWVVVVRDKFGEWLAVKVAEGGGAAETPHRCLLQLGPADITMAPSASTNMTYIDDALIDTDGYYDHTLSTSEITIPAGLAGWYQVGCNISYIWDVGLPDGFYVRFTVLKNGAMTSGREFHLHTNVKYHTTSGNNLVQAFTAMGVLNIGAGDTVQIVGYHTNTGFFGSGGAVNMVANVDATRDKFWLEFIEGF